jgi:hypothetical protein
MPVRPIKTEQNVSPVAVLKPGMPRFEGEEYGDRPIDEPIPPSGLLFVPVGRSVDLSLGPPD